MAVLATLVGPEMRAKGKEGHRWGMHDCLMRLNGVGFRRFSEKPVER